MKRGVFISFEGCEGCGKSTQVARLQDRLRAAGHSLLHVREPGGTIVGETIRHLLQHTPEAQNMTPESELLLFAASRAQLVREKIQPALADGIHVLADRFWDSTTVYQGAGRKLNPVAVRIINKFAVGDCVPDLTFLLDVPVEIGLERAMARHAKPDRMESESLAFHQAVRQAYLRLAEEDPLRIAIIDATATPDEMSRVIWNNLDERFHGLFS